MRGQRRCPQGPSSTTQWSADPSSHWAQPGPADRTHTCLPGRSSIHPPNTSYLCPAQHPLPQLPTRPAGPLEPQPGCRPGLQLGPGHGRVGAAGDSTAAPGSRSAPCPVQEGYMWVPREGVKGREKGPRTTPSGLLLGVQARKAPGARRPEQQVETCPPGAAGGPCVCMFTEGREGRGPGKPQDDRPLPRDRQPPPYPKLLDIWGDPVGKGRQPGSPASFPGGPPHSPAHVKPVPCRQGPRVRLAGGRGQGLG